MDAVVFDLRQRKLFTQPCRIAPVRGGALAVEQPGPAQQKSAGTDGAVTGHVFRHQAQPGRQRGVFFFLRQLRAASHQHDIVIATRLVQTEIKAQLLAIRCADRRWLCPHGKQAIALASSDVIIRFGKHIHRPRYIERLYAGKDQQRDGFHAEAGKGANGKYTPRASKRIEPIATYSTSSKVAVNTMAASASSGPFGSRCSISIKPWPRVAMPKV